MIHAIGMDCVQQAVQQLPTMLGEKINTRNFPFLENFVGIERIAENTSVAIRYFGLAKFGPCRARAQIGLLIQHRGLGVVGRVNQGLVERLEQTANRSHRTLDRCPRLIK